jgi:hypothetical protein
MAAKRHRKVGEEDSRERPRPFRIQRMRQDTAKGLVLEDSG